MIWLAGLFLLAHGLVHLGIWCTPFDPAKAPFDPRHSWLADRMGQEGRGRGLAVVLAVVAAAAFLVAGTGVLIDTAWAQAAAIGGATVSLLLTLVYFHPWLAFNGLINAAIIFVALR
jgi:hypothetical protein